MKCELIDIFEITFFLMTRRAIIQSTIDAISNLPDDKAQEISDFAAFIRARYEESLLNQGIQVLVSESPTFDFLNDDEDLYSVADLKEVYNG